MENIISDTLFTEKYRPSTIDELLVPERIKTKLRKGPYQHLLLYSSPGTSKTKTAIILFDEFKIPFIYINASQETSIDVLRDKIEKWCSTMSIIDGNVSLKGVILDEIDGVSDAFEKALKATIERFEKKCRFIATTNHINKVSEGVKSRFELINYDFNEDEEKEVFKNYCKRILEICKEEGLKISKEALVELIKRKFPDMRAILRVLQGYANEGIKEITIDTVKKYHGVYKDVYELIFTKDVDPVKNYQFLVSNYSHKVDDILSTLGNEFIEYIQMEKPKHVRFIPQVIVEVANHQSQRTQVIDEVITMLSCVFKLQTIVNS